MDFHSHRLLLWGTRMNNINDFIKNKLDIALASTRWVNISSTKAVGVLAKNFSVYQRIRPLNQILNLSSNEFSRYSSLANIIRDADTLLIACDSEWFTLDNIDGSHRRYILSWQFAFIMDDMLVEVIFLPKNLSEKNPLSGRLDLLDALSVLYCLSDNHAEFLTFDIRAYRKYEITIKDEKGNSVEKVFKTKKAAMAISPKVKTIFDFPKKMQYLDVCLLFHTGLVDITAFDSTGHDMVYDQNIREMVLKKLKDIHHGLVSLNKIKVYSRLQSVGNGHCRLFPFKLSVRDTLNHAPPKQGSLEVLGTAIGVSKVSIPDHIKAHMDTFLLTDPIAYFEYASTDSVVTLLYSSSLYGVNVTPKVTITSAAAGILRDMISDYFDVPLDEKEEFDIIYRGLRKVSKGNVPTSNMQVPYIRAMAVEPINLDTQKVQYMASFAYHGGYNGCSEVGYFTNHTYDYDLKNAYPTAMVPIPDIDWDNPIKKEWGDLSIPDCASILFTNATPLQLMYAHIQSFKFPKTTKFPCIPVVVDGIPIYPLEYDMTAEYCKNVPSVYITGPELYLAYKLGCCVVMDKLYELNPLMHTINSPAGTVSTVVSHSLAEGVKSFVEDRAQAKARARKLNLNQYLPDTILKIMVNSCYGKVAQNVIEKRAWDAYTEEMTSIGASFITNPVSASLITAIVRCVLIAVQNQCAEKGYHVYSVTTDGFISDVPESVLTALDLYGFSKVLYEARMFLTNNHSGAIWEIKHQQDDLLNFTTRGNASLDPNGVLARNNVVTPMKKHNKDSFLERFWLMDVVLSRTKKVQYKFAYWAKFKSIVLNKCDDFDIIVNKKDSSMDYDMKRKPVYESMVTEKPVIAGNQYEIACFTTIPFNNVGEYKRYRTLKDWIITERKDHPGRALRTLYDWETRFFLPLARHSDLSRKTVRRGTKTEDNNNAVAKPNHKKSLHPSLSAKDRGVMKKIRNCLYAHRAGVITIPLLKSDVNLFFSTLNNSGLCKGTFTKEDYKNYLKRSRWPLPIRKAVDKVETDSLVHFLEEQEPIYSALLSLK